MGSMEGLQQFSPFSFPQPLVWDPGESRFQGPSRAAEEGGRAVAMLTFLGALMGQTLFFACNTSLVLTKPREGWYPDIYPILQMRN